jgi:hypothetical protein
MRKVFFFPAEAAAIRCGKGGRRCGPGWTRTWVLFHSLARSLALCPSLSLSRIPRWRTATTHFRAATVLTASLGWLQTARRRTTGRASANQNESGGAGYAKRCWRCRRDAGAATYREEKLGSRDVGARRGKKKGLAMRRRLRSVRARRRGACVFLIYEMRLLVLCRRLHWGEGQAIKTRHDACGVADDEQRLPVTQHRAAHRADGGGDGERHNLQGARFDDVIRRRANWLSLGPAPGSDDHVDSHAIEMIAIPRHGDADRRVRQLIKHFHCQREPDL